MSDTERSRPRRQPVYWLGPTVIGLVIALLLGGILLVTDRLPQVLGPFRAGAATPGPPEPAGVARRMAAS